MTGSSHGQVLRSSAIIGSASLIGIALGVLRMKVAALVVGVAGLGLIGIYLNVVNAVTALAGLGFGASAVRAIAAAHGAGDTQRLVASRRALAGIIAATAAVSALAIVALRTPIAEHVLADARLAPQVGWLSLAVGLTVISTIPVILLNAYRRIADIAWVQVLGALIGTLGGLAALAIWHQAGVIAYVIAAPLGTLAVSAGLAMKLPRASGRVALAPVVHAARDMIGLGAAFMLSTFALSASVLAVRSILEHRLNPAALGYFAAAWSISGNYVGLVLQAMGMDYYPKLSARIHDREAAARLVNEQMEIAVLLATPVLLVTLAGAPWILQAAYSAAFRESADLLRWQVFGDVFKIAAWPLSMAVLAANRGRLFLGIEAAASTLFFVLVWILIDRLQLIAAGIGYALMYLCYFLVLHRAAGIALNRHTRAVCGGAMAVVAIEAIVSLASDRAGVATGAVLTAIAVVAGWRRLVAVDAVPPALLRLARRRREG